MTTVTAQTKFNDNVTSMPIIKRALTSRRVVLLALALAGLLVHGTSVLARETTPPGAENAVDQASWQDAIKILHQQKGPGRFAKIGILGAFDGEVAYLVDQMQARHRTAIAGKAFYRGKLAGKSVVVVLSGVGTVNAAHTAQILIDRFKVDAIIVTGSAGPLIKGIGVLDSVIATSTQQFTMDFRPLFPLGEIPFQKVSIFPADSLLIQLARRAAASLPEGKTYTGKILSGDQLTPSAAAQAILQGTAVESEGSAVGQVCYLNRVPYVVIRTMSNTLADPDEYAKYQASAARRSQTIVLGLLRALR
jgi:adenosylhomocysteine nucleosidase